MPTTQSISHLIPETPAPKHYFGKYRGTVEDNVDPLRLGRIIAIVPAVGSVIALKWAMPCTPFPATGATPLTLPPIGAHVWIEFEAGDPSYPVWSGGFWTEGQPPLLQIP